MSKKSANNESSNSFILIASFTLVLVIVLAVVGGFYFFFTTKPAPRPPVPKGQAEIHIEFKGISTDRYNRLNAFAREMAGEHAAHIKGSDAVPDIRDASSFHGLLNGGFVNQQFRPNESDARSDVEKAMKDRLEEFLRDNNIDGRRIKFDLQYGK